MKEPLLVIMDVLLIISAFVITFNVLRLLLYIFGKNESDMSRHKAIVTTICTAVVIWVMQYAASSHIGIWWIAAAIGVCILLIKMMCWVRLWKSFIVTPTFIACGYATFLGLTMLGDHFFPDRRTLLGDMRNSGQTISQMASQEGGESAFTGKSIGEIFKMILVGLGSYKDAALDAAGLLQDKDKVRAMTADHESDLIEVGVLSTNRFGDAIDVDLDLTRADPRDVMKILQQLADDPRSVDPAVLQAIQGVGLGTGGGDSGSPGTLSIAELQAAVETLHLEDGSDGGKGDMAQIAGLLSHLPSSSKKGSKKRKKKQTVEQQQATALLTAIATAVEREKFASSGAKISIKKSRKSRKRKTNGNGQHKKRRKVASKSTATNRAAKPVSVAEEVQEVEVAGSTFKQLEEPPEELENEMIALPIPGEIVDGWQYLSKEEYDTAWLDAKNEIKIESTIEQDGKWMAVINEKTVAAGDTVSVDYDGQTYVWRLAEITEFNVVCDPVRSVEVQ